MPAVRIRQPFLASFIVLLLLSAYLGLSTARIPTPYQSDKGLHFVTFFLLTLTFYWILDTARRRCIHLTLLVCTAGLSIGSEFVQAFLPNDRIFDPYDILANVLGSGLALVLSSWYHKRMLERKRKAKHYDIVPGDEPGDETDVELGHVREHQTGVIVKDGAEQASVGAAKPTDVTEELDHWDENAEDWDDEATAPKPEDPKLGAGPHEEDLKKRTD